ncbi:hypothetical protein TNIN_125621 [Trichonephila inaurata madagascariensis]|uniref:Uncharacterized protein n=1 Tax=Trichonephila inaurata madagascariensis TaxID=2747483 RepID=A0A8X6Y308_9ARAC|nr:hypothetical protein TNIN_125621 [Trichonephila inaurata madagascariensis]
MTKSGHSNSSIKSIAIVDEMIRGFEGLGLVIPVKHNCTITSAVPSSLWAVDIETPCPCSQISKNEFKSATFDPFY